MAQEWAMQSIALARRKASVGQKLNPFDFASPPASHVVAAFRSPL